MINLIIHENFSFYHFYKQLQGHEISDQNFHTPPGRFDCKFPPNLILPIDMHYMLQTSTTCLFNHHQCRFDCKSPPNLNPSYRHALHVTDKHYMSALRGVKIQSALQHALSLKKKKDHFRSLSRRYSSIMRILK